jgi:hypothetical protein
MIEIKNFPKDIQRLILSYLPRPTQNIELLRDIRNFTVSLSLVKTTFLEITHEILGDDIISYSEEEIKEYVNFNIFHKLLVELMYTIPDNHYFFCNFIPLFMVTREWILKYQKNSIYSIINNISNLENKIRFIFGIMNPENRNKFVDFYNFREDFQEEEDYDW